MRVDFHFTHMSNGITPVATGTYVSAHYTKKVTLTGTFTMSEDLTF